MFPGGYILDYARPRARKTDAASPRTSSPVFRPSNMPSTTTTTTTATGVFSATTFPHASVTELEGHACAFAGGVDTKFALPPVLITCLVRHIDIQHNVLATPAIVEHCLRDLQRRLMPWVPVERVFNSTMQATAPAGAAPSTSASPAAFANKSTVVGGVSQPSVGAAIPGGSLSTSPPTSTPQTGSYLAGSHVRLQLAKTTDNSVVTAVGASVLHLLLYAVDQPESRPSHLIYIVQEWMEALKTKGEEHDCMVLLVHSDLVVASEAAAQMAEEAQRVDIEQVGMGTTTTSPSRLGTSTTPPPPPPPAARPAVSQDKVDAAAAQLRKYYKELQDLKFSCQQVSAYMPNETPMRILERLRPAVIARGERLRQALQIAASRKRQYPQDPSTKPLPVSASAAQAPASTQTPAPAPPPPPPSSLVQPAAANSGGTGEVGSSPQRITSSATAAAATSTPTARRGSMATGTIPQSPQTGTLSALSSSAAVAADATQYFNIQALWRTGYDLVVHYLQYGFVFDARDALENLYLEYYNNSDDYIFLRTPIATLERLGRVPNLFEAHGHSGWDIGHTGYPKALESGSELLEGLLLLASAEMACSQLLGEPTAALLRYNTFIQVTREKFEEWTASEAKAKLKAVPAAPPPQQQQQKEGLIAAPRITSSTYQQFFLLQCYLSGLRMWWSTSGLCRLRKVPSTHASPIPASAATIVSAPAVAGGTPINTKKDAGQQREEDRQKQEQRDDDSEEVLATARNPTNAASLFSPLSLPPMNVVPPLNTETKTELPTPEMDPEDGSVAVALSTSPLLLPVSGNAVPSFAPAPAFTTTYVTSSPCGGGDDGAVSAPAAPEPGSYSQVFSNTLDGNSGVRYSMTNPSFAASGETSVSGLSSRGLSSFTGRMEPCSRDRHVDGVATSPLHVPANLPSHCTDDRAVKCSSSSSSSSVERAPLEVESEREGSDDDDGEATELVNSELSYLMSGSEDTIQMSADSLVGLAVSTGLVAPSMEPEELGATAEAIRDAFECGDAVLVRDLRQRQHELRRRCVEAASLLEHARDSLAAVAHDLGYHPFSHFTTNTSSFNKGGQPGQAASSPDTTFEAAPTVTNTFSNVEELSSPAQALRLWRVLAAMAALALHISDQRRREFHLYARLAVTFLCDHPTVTANVVANRLLPYVKRMGWSHIELFVRRLYLEALERLMQRVGLFSGNGCNAAARSKKKGDSQQHLNALQRVFKSGPAYALYRECILVLIDSYNSTATAADGNPSDTTASSLSVEGTAETQQQQSSTGVVTPSPFSPSPKLNCIYAAASITGDDDAVGALDPRLFAYRSNAQWWRELLRVDAIVMGAFYPGDPPEYPLTSLTIPPMVRLEKQHSPSAAAPTTSPNVTPCPSPATGALKVDVGEAVRLTFVMTCVINPLMGPDGDFHLQVASSNTPNAESAQTVRLQLTLESRKDWADEEEATHVVHIHDCEEAVYDEATHQLRAVFLFPVCHAGVHRVRCLRLCNGKTWLTHYPQHGSVHNSNLGNSSGGDAGTGRRKLHTLLALSGGGQTSREVLPTPPTRVAVDTTFQPVSRGPILRVPEPRSSVHLTVTLPEEAHCFADSVDYVMLDVDLEDPLSLTVAPSNGDSATAGRRQPSSASFSRNSNDKSRGETARTAAETAAHQRQDRVDEGPECTCYYEASPRNLLLPLSATAASAEGLPSHGPETSTEGDVANRMSQQQYMPSVPPGYRALLGGCRTAESVCSFSGNASPRGPPLIAAVVLGTPNVYRQKSTSGNAGGFCGGAPTRTNPGASFSHNTASHSPDGGVNAVRNGGGSMTEMGNSLFHRGCHNLHRHHSHLQHLHEHSSHRTTPADVYLSSSLHSTSHSTCSSPPVSAAAVAQGVTAAGVPRPANSRDVRYKSVFKSLRVSSMADAPTGATANTTAYADPALSISGCGASTSQTTTADRQCPKPAHHHASSHQYHCYPRSPATSEPSAHDAVLGEEGFVRRPGQSFSGVAYLAGVGGGTSTAAGASYSPLHRIDQDTFELVLKHPVANMAVKDGSEANARVLAGGAAASTSLSKAAVAGAAAPTAAVAYTSIPIHLSAFLSSIPTPGVQVQVPDSFSNAESKQVAGLVATPGPLLQAVSSGSASAVDKLRENVICLYPSDLLLQAIAGSKPDDAAINPAAAETFGNESEKPTTVRIPITKMHLRVPLLPLLVTPASAVQTKPGDASSGATDNVTNKNSNTNAPAVTTTTSPSSASPSAEAAKQARIMFTCMRGREPSTTSLSLAIPFQLAISFTYAFKHFQGRVYCLVRMKNLLKVTSLWLRGAVLRVLDPEPSYEIVRVCDVYNELLLTEWKPQDELSILYELDLIASFHPVQPECAHQVQMQVFYSSWEKSFVTTPAEDRLVLRTVQLPPTEATAENVELIHGEDGVLPSLPYTPDTAFSLGSSPSRDSSNNNKDRGSKDDYLHSRVRSEMEAEESVSGPPSTRAPLPGDHSRIDSTNLQTRTDTTTAAASDLLFDRGMSTTVTAGLSEHSEGSVTRSATQIGHPGHHRSESPPSKSRESCEDDVDRSLRCSDSSSPANSGVVHFNVVTLRHLEETCNTVLGPAATFHSKHLCVFSIVMYAESPWTMRFGAATNYIAKAPGTPLSSTPSTTGAQRGGEGPLPCSSFQSSGVNQQHISNTTFSRTHSSAASFSGNGTYNNTNTSNNPVTVGPSSFFGNAMVDQPSDFIFVAGEPVRFCVRLQPMAQNWPEDANMEETFFIRLKYNPAEWMVIGKQRDRRTLSLMEEVTVYFNAVPLLPRTSVDVVGEDGVESFPRSPTAVDYNRKARLQGAHLGVAEDPELVEDDDEESVVNAMRQDREGINCQKGGTRSSRPLAGHAVRDEGILQTPTVEMFWERKKPAAGSLGTTAAAANSISSGAATQDEAAAAAPSSTHGDAAMGEAVLIDVVQFRTWVRVRKHGH